MRYLAAMAETHAPIVCEYKNILKEYPYFEQQEVAKSTECFNS
jgi:hypothetical protein